MYLLDTNVCIRFLNGRSPSIRERMRLVHPSQIYVCSVVKAELFYGAAKSQYPERTREKQLVFLGPLVSLDFDDHSAKHYAQIRAELERKGLPIGPNDLMIAAIALANGLTLVTANQSEFARVPNLTQECWDNPTAEIQR